VPGSLCLGMQVMTIEYRPQRLGLDRANSSEFDPHTPHPVIDLMDAQRGVTDKGGTMRLGAYIAELEPGSKVAEAYGTRWSQNVTATATSSIRAIAASSTRRDLSCSGTSPDHRLVEFIELRDHPFWVATQGHPEFKSRPTRPAPLFAAFVAAAAARTAATRVEVPQGEAASSEPQVSDETTAGRVRGRRSSQAERPDVAVDRDPVGVGDGPVSRG
jgi:CTP synthase